MASQVAQQGAKRQLSKGREEKKKRGKTTVFIVTHDLPLFPLNRTHVCIRFQNKRYSMPLVEGCMSVMKYVMYVQVVFENPGTQLSAAKILNDSDLLIL